MPANNVMFQQYPAAVSFSAKVATKATNWWVGVGGSQVGVKFFHGGSQFFSANQATDFATFVSFQMIVQEISR